MGTPGDAKEWLKAAGKMFDEESTAWFARPLYSYGWLKGKPALPCLVISGLSGGWKGWQEKNLKIL